MAITGDIAVIGGRLAYSTVAAAELAAKDIGCEGYHTHELDGREWYMPCYQHAGSDHFMLGRLPTRWLEDERR